jgi:hypothetical protein
MVVGCRFFSTFGRATRVQNSLFVFSEKVILIDCTTIIFGIFSGWDFIIYAFPERVVFFEQKKIEIPL